MAEEQIVTNIVAKSDFSNLITDLNKVSSALSNLQAKLNATNKNLSSQVNVMNRSFAETMRSTGQYSTHFVSLTSDVDKFGTQLDKGQVKLKQFAQIYQSHIKTSGGLVRQLAQQQVQLQNAILQPLGKNAEGLMQYNVHIPAGLDKVKSKTALAKQELQIMNKVVQEGANSLINWGKNTQWAGRQLTVGLTLPLAAFGKASADAFRAADQELTRLTKVYGGLAATSAEELGKVRQDVTKTAAELSKAYGSSFKETIALGADIAATGKQGNELLGSIRETTRLAVLGEVDRQDAMKATLAIQSAFKSNTDELAESINFLNAVENQTSTTLNDLVEAIPKAGPIIKGLGGDVQDLALYLTAMREGGVSASEGANALKSGLASLINPTKVAKDMFAGFGISLTDIVERNAGNTTETLLALQSALDRLNPLQKQQALEQLFGKFQFARMNALFENLGKQGSQTLQVMDLMKASSQELANIAGRELSMVTESASGKYRRALEGLKADLAGVGDQFLTINTNLINIVDGILKFVNKLPGPIKAILSLFGGLTALAGPMIMLTGVLGNFFGYIIKGVSHFKALAKGGEGWKLLTPEILAANKAGGLVEQTFYSDAKASEILNTAINRLSASYQRLAADANNAIISTNPAISTTAGNLLMTNKDPRMANPAHSMIGPFGSRAAAHHNPRGDLTPLERSQQTIHSITPQPELVNQAIKKNPQIFTYQNMPNIPGLTNIGGVSTGIVAGEAAKWHTLMSTLSMQTKQEVAQLEKEIARTGTVSQEFMSTYSQILPAMTSVVDNAVLKSQQIIQKVQMGELQVDQARAKIIAINAKLEADMIATSNAMAAQMSRNANLTGLPLTGQAIVDKTGKSNVREMFRDDRKVKQMMDAIARATGVRTSGGGYSIETTVPKKFATGGRVFGGPRSDTTDTQFEYLPEGAFVLNRKASDALLGFNQGGMVPAMVTPGEILIENPTPNEVDMLEAYNNQFAVGGKVTRSKNNYGKNPIGLSNSKKIGRKPGRETPQKRGNRDIRQIEEINGIEFATRGSNTLLALKRSIEGSSDPKLAAKIVEDYMLGITSKTHNRSQTLQAKDFRSGSPLRTIWEEKKLGELHHVGPRTHSTHATKARVDELGNRYVSRYTYQYDAYGNERLQKGIAVKDFIKLNSQYTGKYNDLFAKTGVPKNKWQDLEKEIDNSIFTKYGKSNRTISDDLPGTLTLEDNFSPIVDKAILNSFGSNAASKSIAKQTINKLKIKDILRKQKTAKQPARPTFNNESIADGVARYQRIKNEKYLAEYFGKAQPLNRGGVVGGRVRSGKYNYGTDVDWSRTPFGMGFKPTGINSSQTEGMDQSQSSTAGFGKMLGSGIAQNAIFMGGMAGGSAIGGKLGGGLGAFAGSMLGPSVLQAVLSKLGAINKAGSSSASIFTKLGPLMANPYVRAGIAIAAVTGSLIKYKNGVIESARINRLAFGGAIKPLESFDSKLKDVQKSIENTNATAALLHSQFSGTGIAGLTLTAKEFQKIRDTVKATYPDVVKLFKQNDGQDLYKVAAGIKAQFVAAGDAAYTANQKVAALLSEAGKTTVIDAVLGSESVSSIVNAKTALESMLKALSNLRGKSFATGFSQVFTMLDSSMGSSNDKVKTLRDQLESIRDIYGDQIKLTDQEKTALAEQSPVLAQLLEKAGNIADAYALWTIKLAGVSREINLSGDRLQIYAEYVAKVNEQFNKFKDVSSELAQKNPMLGKWAKDIDNFNKQQAKYVKAANNSIEDQISLKEKLIAQIKKEGDARKKALQDQQQIEDVKLQIQQEQLNYQNALAAGDMASAAQAQINIQRLVGQQQLKAAEDAIDDAVQAKIDALQSQIDKLNQAKSTQKEVKAKSDPSQEIYNQILTLFKDIATGDLSATDEKAQTRLNDLIQALMALPNGQGSKYLKELGFTGPSAATKVREDRGTTQVPVTSTPQSKQLQDILSRGSTNLGDLGTTNSILRDILKAIKNGGDVTPTPEKDPNAQSKGATGDTVVQGQAKEQPGKTLEKAGLNAFNDRTTGTANSTRGSFKTFTWNGKTYAVNTTDGQIYDFDGKTVGKKSLGTARAEGGRVVPGREYRVGERGEETFRPDTPGTIYPNPKTAPSYAGINPTAMGASWLGNTISKASNSVIKNILGFDITKPFSQKSNMEKLSMALFPLGGGGLGAKALTSSGREALALQKTLSHLSPDANLGKNLIDPLAREGAKLGKYGRHPLYFAEQGSMYSQMSGQYGSSLYNMSLSPAAKLKTLFSKGYLTPDKLKSEFNIDPKDMLFDSWTPELISKFRDMGYLGYKAGDGIVTNWVAGAMKGFGLKNVSIPKFKNGINSVPVDMLAQLHANEAVIPANMNPFNPNANNATMGNTYNFSPVINAAPGMDVKELGDVIIKRFEASVGLKTTVEGRNRVI